jgi:DNA-binding CsgD family transcriptional regulator
MPDHQELSERELQILRLVATGASNKEIAFKLKISTNTVKVHLRNIFEKISVASRTEAALFAVKNGLVGDAELPVMQVENGYQEEHYERSNEIENAKSDEQGSATRNRRKRITTYWVITLIVFITGGAIFLWLYLSNYSSPIAPNVSNGELARWKVLTPLLTERMNFALVRSGNQIYAISGQTTDGVTGKMEVYDKNNERWSEAIRKPQPVSDILGSVISGMIFIPGGIDPNGKVLDILEIYDPETSSWSQGASLPKSISAYAITSLEGRLYLFGGWDGQTYLNDVFLFDPNSGQWKILSPMSERRAFASAAISGGKIYVFGGKNETGVLSSIEVFSPPSFESELGKWGLTIPLPEERYAMGAAGLADMIFIVGGKDKKNNCLPGLVFYPEKKEWQSFQVPFENNCIGIGITEAGAEIYVAGGEGDGEVENQFLSFQAIYNALLPLVPQP